MIFFNTLTLNVYIIFFSFSRNVLFWMREKMSFLGKKKNYYHLPLIYLLYYLDQTNIGKEVNNVEESSASGLIIGITVAAIVVLTLIITIMVVYYKRRVQGIYRCRNYKF